MENLASRCEQRSHMLCGQSPNWKTWHALVPRVHGQALPLQLESSENRHETAGGWASLSSLKHDADTLPVQTFRAE